MHFPLWRPKLRYCRWLAEIRMKRCQQPCRLPSAFHGLFPGLKNMSQACFLPRRWRCRPLRVLLPAPRKGRPSGLPFLGAGNRTRTCTLSQWNLNPPSLPIPPCPHILFASFLLHGEADRGRAVRLICPVILSRAGSIVNGRVRSVIEKMFAFRRISSGFMLDNPAADR